MSNLKNKSNAAGSALLNMTSNKATTSSRSKTTYLSARIN